MVSMRHLVYVTLCRRPSGMHTIILPLLTLVKLNLGLPWQKRHLTRRRTFYQQIGLKFEEETSEVLRLEHGSVWC